jgi:hydroxyethylthiazole kinase-like uncharacterized protein yjeF
LVLCGPGNNGGDGFVIARLLRDRGWEIDLYLFGDPDKLPPDAARNHARWVGLGAVTPWDAETILSAAPSDLIVDAVFGIGLTRPLPQDVAQVLDRPGKDAPGERHLAKVVAVDCPSGLDLDSGRIPYNSASEDPSTESRRTWLNRADLTVTFHSPKPGHYLNAGPIACGTIEVVDIGLTGDATERVMICDPPDAERARLVEARFDGQMLPSRVWPLGEISKAGLQGHKFDHGHVVVFAGGPGRGGAGRLAARAALRVGAGLVTVFCPPAALHENAARLDAIMLRPVGDAAALAGIVDDRMRAFCLGPGIGVGAETREMVGAVLRLKRITVLDADALTSFAQEPGQLFAGLHDRCILTPHFGEFERLFPDLAREYRRAETAPLDCVRLAAKRAGAIVLLKGPSTIIAHPQGGVSVHAAQYERSVPWLATAGAGDVLAGMIAGIAASATSTGLFNATEAAVWLHVEAARHFGPGLIAEDLPEALPSVFRALQA